MFARIKKNSGTKRRSVLVCHNVRVHGKVKQITIKTFGHTSDFQQWESWFHEARMWVKGHHIEGSGHGHYTQITMKRTIPLCNIKEEARINVGVEDIFGLLYQELGFHRLLSTTHQDTLRKMIFARLLEPGSKRRLTQVVEEHFAQEMEVGRVYRMMDQLLEGSVAKQHNVL